MIVLSEQSQRRPPPPSQIDTDRIATVLTALGCRELRFGADFEEQGLSFEDILGYLRADHPGERAYYNGFIPSWERYDRVDQACRARDIALLNSPEQMRRAVAVERWYPRLEGLTPETAIIEELDQLDDALARTGLPAFLKGSVKSMKHRGPLACIARSAHEARQIAGDLFAVPWRSRGRVVVRRLLRLRHARGTTAGFPLGREFRVFLYRDQILAKGYYWEGYDPLAKLSQEDEAAIDALAARASLRLEVPYVCIDVGQCDDGSWWVIEPGDGQFAGLSHVDPLELLGRLMQMQRSGA